MRQAITDITIYILVPFLGLLCYLYLVKRIYDQKINKPPTFSLFLLLATYGGLLLVVLTTLFSRWSALASLGSLYLILIAPFVKVVLAYRMHNDRAITIYHRWVYYSCLLYFLIAPLVFGVLITVS